MVNSRRPWWKSTLMIQHQHHHSIMDRMDMSNGCMEYVVYDREYIICLQLRNSIMTVQLPRRYFIGQHDRGHVHCACAKFIFTRPQRIYNANSVCKATERFALLHVYQLQCAYIRCIYVLISCCAESVRVSFVKTCITVLMHSQQGRRDCWNTESPGHNTHNKPRCWRCHRF